ncbi:gliding motility lipoprotein GldD [Christiangramia sabulilitoris]|uniref:Gliding motility lipoprotein GldD n=1 Tax=Christiangramia sabulilitoris TaxID=2583991 RepID=A0A550I0F9_9FLAO|nr:gliding motility lipoprotein GldD [Christiangramia sabulilitoris]TRO64435.1 gliding motility lipoprotein GldD [Christiangramia sabulilitoris]
MRLIISFLLLAVLSISCKDDPRPKPKGFLALEYPNAEYERVDIGCPYTFDKNVIAEISPSRNRIPCWIQLDYDEMKGSVFITYQPVENNLDSLLSDAQKLPLQHTIKADLIEGDVYTNDLNRTYGMFYEVDGNAASQAQFYLTDSTHHFLTGSVYFKSLPNFDSIVPAADYLKADIRHLMESLKWNY